MMTRAVVLVSMAELAAVLLTLVLSVRRRSSVKIFLKSGFQGWKKGGINIHVSVPLCEIWISIFLKSRFQEVESRVRKNLSGKNFNET